MTGYINAYHHSSPHAGTFSFNADSLVHETRALADQAASLEMSFERHTRRVGVWRIKAK